MQSHLHINILAWSRPLMTFLTERAFPLRLASPLIGGRGLYKRERTLWRKLLSKKSKSVDSEPTLPPAFSRVDFSEQQPFPSLHFVPDRAPVRVAHPYLINDNNIDRILHYLPGYKVSFQGGLNSMQKWMIMSTGGISENQSNFKEKYSFGLPEKWQM